ncbi:HPr kinase/phosphorylase [Virgibacillus sp. L01]|uniref:HPr kinase/phosphorylase n=1 Tax=Virgibacillus sp. L01 TaxID=3457429 RepID=UPI003FD2ED19
MINTLKKFTYRAFGLSIFSEFFLPELPQIDMEEHLASVKVHKADLTGLWSELSEGARYFVVEKDFTMFHVPDTAIYLVKNGREIFVSPIEGSEEDQIRLYILGTCMGALLMQRMVLPLHGSALVIYGKAYAIVGDSGAGKSTLASALLKRGYQLLSDDVIPVTLSEKNVPIVTPAYPQQKLWQESLDQFGIESKQLRPIIDRETKFAVPVLEQFAEESVPLAGVFELIRSDVNEIEVTPIQKLERFHTLFHHTYRNFIISRSGMMDWHFSTSASMVNKIDFHRLIRPTTHFTADNLADLILTRVNKKEEIV